MGRWEGVWKEDPQSKRHSVLYITGKTHFWGHYARIMPHGIPICPTESLFREFRRDSVGHYARRMPPYTPDAGPCVCFVGGGDGRDG